MSKIFHVELKNQPRESRHHYFGSKTAIYDSFSWDDIGISKADLWNTDLSKFPYLYENEKCIIRQGALQRTKNNREKND